MTNSSNQPNEERSRDAEYWANPVSTLTVSEMPSEATNINVEGRHVVGPLQGFGRMWQKTYWIDLGNAQVTSVEVIKHWKENFSTYWPEGNRFYAPLTGIAPGEVAVLNLATPGGLTLSTGVMVIYADDESFTFMTPEGHIFSGWITFSAFVRDECIIAQTQVLIRPNDPLYEIAFRLGGSKAEDSFWINTMESLAEHFGVDDQAQMIATCVDPRLQWSQAKNIWHNAAIRSTVYAMFAPVRWLRRAMTRR